MISNSALSLPAIERPAQAVLTPDSSFVAKVVIEHGPRAALSQTFLLADQQLRDQGVLLGFATMQELVSINRANLQSWSPLLPLFDPSLNDLDDSNCFAVVGRSVRGEAIVTAAARLYELGSTTLAQEIESLRIFYRDPASSAAAGEAVKVSSLIARIAQGTVVFSGGAWVHPDWRGKPLIDAVAPVVRGIGLTRWRPGLTFSFMVPELVRNGTAKRWFMNTDWEVTMVNTPVKRNGTIRAALSWTTPSLMLEHFEQYVEGRSRVAHR